MKKMLLVLGFCGVALVSRAQTMEEWLQQKETALKYLGTQILALKGYGEVLKEGYDIVQTGVTLIGAIKGADYEQHGKHFQERLSVNPVLQGYSKTIACRSLQIQIEKLGERLFREAGKAPALRREEKLYLQQVVEAVLRESNGNLMELQKVLQDGTYGMKDNERLTRIHRTYRDLLEKNLILQSLHQQMGFLIEARAREANHLNRMKKIYTTK